jgi:hypothetical protein
MTKILNLDTIETPEKVLHFHGVDHKFQPFTVEQFITEMKRAEERDKDGAKIETSEAVTMMVAMIKRSFPTVEEADLAVLPLDRLKVISDFVNDVNEEEGVQAVEASKPEDTGEAKN